MYLPVVTFRTMPFIIRGTPAVPQVPFLWITQSKSPFTINKGSYGLTLKTCDDAAEAILRVIDVASEVTEVNDHLK